MARLTDEMKELVAAQQCFVATVSPDGAPNISPKRSTRVLDDEHLMFTEVTGRQTWTNLQAGSKVAIGVVDRDNMVGYRFMGTPEIITSGQLFEAAAETMRARGIPLPVKAVVVVKVDAIHNLGFAPAGRPSA